MNNAFQSLHTIEAEMEPFEDRVDTLFRELELAIQWQRPSILLAIFNSEYVNAEAKSALKSKLKAISQDVQHLQITSEENSDIPLHLAEFAGKEKTVFFVEGLRWGGGKDGARAFRALSIGREYLIDKRIRAVFWLTENEANELAHHAPDFWAYRHRVVEFIESPAPGQISLRALEATWQGIGEYADNMDGIDEKISLREMMLKELPQGEDSTAIRGDLLFALGVLHWRRGDYEKSLSFLHSTQEIATRTHNAWFEASGQNALALVNIALGKVDQAIVSLRQAAALAPQLAYPWNNLGNLYTELNRDEEAITALEAALALNPLDAVSWNGLGKVYHKLGREDDSAYAYKKAIDCDPACAYAWIGLGDIHATAQHYEKAIHAYRKAIEIDSHLVHPWISLGNIYKKQRMSKEAIQAYQKAFEIDPRNALIWNEQGNVYLEAGVFDEAMSAYVKAIELDHSLGWPYCSLAYAYTEQGKYEEAIPLYQKSIYLFNNNEDQAIAWNRLGKTYWHLNDTENAIAAFERAIELAPNEEGFKDDLNEIQRELPEQAESREDTTHAEKGDVALLDRAAAEAFILDPHRAQTTPDPAFRNIEAGQHDQDNARNEYERTVGAFIADANGGAGYISQSNAGVGFLDPLEEELHYNLPHMEAAHAAGVGRTNAILKVDVISEEQDRSNLGQGRVFAWIDLGDLHSDVQQLAAAIVTEKEARAAPLELDEVVPVQAQVMAGPVAVVQAVKAFRVGGVSPAESPAPHQGSTEPKQNQLSTDDHSNDEAIKAYKTVVKNNPGNPRAWHTLGNLHRTSGHYNEALEAFERAVAIDPKREVFHYHLGLVYAALKRFDEAVRSFQKVVELNPEYNLAHCTLAGYYRRLGQENEARKHITIASPTMKDETEYNRACFAAICGDADQALTLLRESLEKKQTTPDWVRRDPDLEFIRDDPRFTAMVGG